jgi:hypothetical protein
MTDNVKLDLYNDIETALINVVDSNNNKLIKNVLKYNSQDVNNDTIIQKNYPQAWIHFSDISWNPSMLDGHNQNTTQEQKGLISITIHIEQFSLKGNEDTWKSDLTLINLVYRALANMKGENYTSLQRVTEIDHVNNNNVRDWQIIFTTQVTESGISKGQTDAAPVTLIINKQIS